jgi:nicotinamide mononucleotide adenylyltransferase
MSAKLFEQIEEFEYLTDGVHPLYNFNSSKLASFDEQKEIPLILINCGSFSPVTFMHLETLEMARKKIEEIKEIQVMTKKKDGSNAKSLKVIGGFLSPVSNQYEKRGILQGLHRYEMCARALNNNPWISIDTNELLNKKYLYTYESLKLFRYHAIKAIKNDQIKIILVAGTDLIETFFVPGCWALEDIRGIINEFGIVVVQRDGVTFDSILKDKMKQGVEVNNSLENSSDIFQEKNLINQQITHILQENLNTQIYLVEQNPDQNQDQDQDQDPRPYTGKNLDPTLSSTKIRSHLVQKKSIEGMTPNAVIDYIYSQKLNYYFAKYFEPDGKPNKNFFDSNGRFLKEYQDEDYAN